MFDAIGSQGGLVADMAGDGLMSVFGAPLALEDHHRRGVLAGQEMITLMKEFNQEKAKMNCQQIHIGVGIASGPVIAGYVGTQQRASYKCVGDTVNLAARLEAYTKKVGEPILIEENTRLGLNQDIGSCRRGLCS
jgi:adenylate cyclase